MSYASQLEVLRRLRNIEEPCTRCNGTGSLLYSSTATWRGGMGGAAMTRDVCDRCWGSGDLARPWTDLRRLRNEENAQVARRAGEYLADRCGVRLRSLLPGLDELIAELDKFAMQRRKRPYGFTIAARSLAGALRDMVAAKRAELEREAAANSGGAS